MSIADSGDLQTVAEVDAGREIALCLTCQGEAMLGVLHEPHCSNGKGVVIVVGGPNYRVGSHRQFVALARQLCGNGHSVLRFDYRGMGDSDGQQRSFTGIDKDIDVAVEKLKSVDGVDSVFLVGLCDAASAILLYAQDGNKFDGAVLLNPWVREERTEARAYLKHYYLRRLVSAGLWAKIREGKLDWSKSAASLWGLGRKALSPRQTADSQSLPLADRMVEGLRGLRRPTLFVISGSDLTAAEFDDVVSSSKEWKEQFRRDSVSVFRIEGADHTLSRDEWRISAFARIEQWLSNAPTTF